MNMRMLNVLLGLCIFLFSGVACTDTKEDSKKLNYEKMKWVNRETSDILMHPESGKQQEDMMIEVDMTTLQLHNKIQEYRWLNVQLKKYIRVQGEELAGDARKVRSLVESMIFGLGRLKEDVSCEGDTWKSFWEHWDTITILNLEEKAVLVNNYAKALETMREELAKLPELSRNVPEDVKKFLKIIINPIGELADKFVDILNEGFSKHKEELNALCRREKNLKTKEDSKQTTKLSELLRILEANQGYDPSKEKINKEKGALYQICQKIRDAAEAKDPKNLSPKSVSVRCNIRPEPKNPGRMLTKMINKYHMDASKITDSFGCEIITKNVKDQITVMNNLFDAFGEKAQTFEINGKEWDVSIQKVKLKLSEMCELKKDQREVLATDTRPGYELEKGEIMTLVSRCQDEKTKKVHVSLKDSTGTLRKFTENKFFSWENEKLFKKCEQRKIDELRYKYTDDKIIFHVSHKEQGKSRRTYLRVEAIIFVEKVKKMKKKSHDSYDIVRVAGKLVQEKLELVMAKSVQKKVHEEFMKKAGRHGEFIVKQRSPKSRQQQPKKHRRAGTPLARLGRATMPNHRHTKSVAIGEGISKHMGVIDVVKRIKQASSFEAWLEANGIDKEKRAEVNKQCQNVESILKCIDIEGIWHSQRIGDVTREIKRVVTNFSKMQEEIALTCFYDGLLGMLGKKSELILESHDDIGDNMEFQEKCWEMAGNPLKMNCKYDPKPRGSVAPTRSE